MVAFPGKDGSNPHGVHASRRHGLHHEGPSRFLVLKLSRPSGAYGGVITMDRYASHLAGRSYGKLGTALPDPPQITIHGYANVHALDRAVGRDITTQDRLEIVRHPLVVLEQAQGY